MSGYVAWKGWQTGDFGSCSPEQAAYFEHEFRSSGIRSVNGLAVGELGYGNGSCAGWVRRSGGSWVGREAIRELQERAEQAGYKVVPPGHDFADICGVGKLDVLLAFDVLEHLELEVFRAFLKEASVALRSGGLLVFRVPSGDSPFSGAIYCGDLTHRLLLGSAAVRQLANESGFEVVQVRSPAFPVAGLGAVRLLRRAVARAVQRCAYAFIRNVLMSERTAVVSPNMLVVLRNRTL
ncbi:MAG: hypothetical protein V7640_286 [Betaproteobacteria bacterium]|jgi:hypothetical protein